MKRFVVITVLVVTSIAAIKHLRSHRADGAAREARWAWPDAPLSPRHAPEAKPSSFRFASAGGRVHITVDGAPGVRLVSTDDEEQECELAMGEAREDSDESRASGITLVKSDLKYTEDRALNDLNAKITTAISSWLAEAGVPSDWRLPQGLVKQTIRGTPEVTDEERESIGTMYLASVPLELSRPRKEQFLQEYHRHVAGQRIGILGGGLAFVLTVLAVGVGYVRTDEVTKGYYTNRLRMLAAAGIGAAGVVLYQWVMRNL